jgi:excisionase family DNA binding protein
MLDIDNVNLLNTKEIAEKLGTHIDTVRKYIRENRIKAQTISGQLYVTEENLKEFITAGKSNLIQGELPIVARRMSQRTQITLSILEQILKNISDFRVEERRVSEDVTLVCFFDRGADNLVCEVFVRETK